MAPTTPATTAPADPASTTASSIGHAFPPWHPITRSRAAAAAVAAAEAAGLAPPPTPPSATYEGSCHCGALAFAVTLSPPLESGGGGGAGDANAQSPVLNCNCSACRRFGYLLAYPARAGLTWKRGGVDGGPERGVQGADSDGGGGTALGKYQFNSKKTEHLFCRQCGTSVMVDMRTLWAPEFDGFAVNVRTLRGVALDGLALVPFDGMNLVPPAGDLAGVEYGKEKK